MTAQVIAIVGTRGIPARYGGFETLVEQLSATVPSAKVKFSVYGQRSAYSTAEREGPFNGHEREWMPLSASGWQSIIHDALQLAHAVFRRRHRDILLLGTSGAWLLPFIKLMRPSLRIVCNIDGLEWRRDKFGGAARTVLKILEAIAVRFSDVIVADNEALVPMVHKYHRVDPIMIAYGGDHIAFSGEGSSPSGGALAVARVEPENNTLMILEGARMAGAVLTFIGNWEASDYGRKLKKTFAATDLFDLKAPIYDQRDLGAIRLASGVYVHGHSVGGTNPSLVEAIFHSRRILAYDCEFNRATLGNEGGYFSNANELAILLRNPTSGTIGDEARAGLRERYRWATIAKSYLDLFP